MVVNLVV